jgi:hypothetical protein
MDLHEYTDEQIKTEWHRRLAVQNAKAWYYIALDEDEHPDWRPEQPSFILINRRTYHLQHRTQITNISGHLNYFPKKYFKEQKPSYFVYIYKAEDAYKTANELLQKYGYQKLKEPYLAPDAHTVFHIDKLGNRGLGYRVDFLADTPEITKTLKATLTFDNTSMEALKSSIETFANSIGCVSFCYNTNPHGMCVAILKAEILNSLPPNMYSREGNWE